MKNVLAILATLTLSVAFAQNHSVVKPGDAGLNREGAPAPIVAGSTDRMLAPAMAAWSPFALNLFSLSLPSAPQLEVDGLRLNLTVPFATPDHSNVLGFDLGVSGEAVGHVGGIAANFLDNWSRSFAGGAVALVNVTGELSGLQIGLVNVADTGSGLQIGLWNSSQNYKGPLVGIVW